MDTDRFMFHVKTGDVYNDIAEEVEKRLNTSNFDVDRPSLPMGKNLKLIGLMKDKWTNHEKIYWITSKKI